MTKSLLALLLVVGLLAAALSQCSTTATGASGPNIIFVLTDDQAYRGTVAKMPWLRSHQRSFTSFKHAYVNNALCCPSRATILSGLYSHHTHVEVSHDGPKFDASQTIATWLHEAGYRTGLFGKYLNFYPFGRGAFKPRAGTCSRPSSPRPTSTIRCGPRTGAGLTMEPMPRTTRPGCSGRGAGFHPEIADPVLRLHRALRAARGTPAHGSPPPIHATGIGSSTPTSTFPPTSIGSPSMPRAIGADRDPLGRHAVTVSMRRAWATVLSEDRMLKRLYRALKDAGYSPTP